ncbi:MAG: DUF3303 family protein [Phycisphaeraceae bacterium]|nr:DUF3303 family protein [Phycisphaeraceae bacterium]
MLLMVIERFRNGDPRPVYARLRENGRGLPPGLTYIDSWVEAGMGRCFQLMECEDAGAVQRWVAQWSDLVEFEIVPVTSSQRARRALEGDDEPTDWGVFSKSDGGDPQGDGRRIHSE